MRKKRKGIVIFALIILIFSLSIISMSINGTEILASATTGLSNKKIGWGIKRNNNHEQPDLGSKNIKVLTENNGIAMGNSQSKKIYLTFDEGYEAGYTPQILATLKETQVKATFFITAHYVNTQPDLVKQMIDEGHIIRKPHGQSQINARSIR